MVGLEGDAYLAELLGEVSRGCQNSVPCQLCEDLLPGRMGDVHARPGRLSHGDQRLLEYYPKYHKRDYMTPIDRSAFLDAQAQWLSDATPGINFSRETKALVTIHANLSYLSSTIPHGEAFELEHIIAKKRINEVDLATNRKIYGSSLGNCMYLPRQLNNKKKEKTLYEINGSGKYDELIADSLYFSEDEFSVISSALESANFDRINEMIEGRGKRVGEDLIDRLLKG